MKASLSLFLCLTLSGCGSFMPPPPAPPSPPALVKAARDLDTALAKGDEEAAAVAVQAVTAAAKAPTQKVAAVDPVETAATVAGAVGTVWPPAAVIAAALAAFQTFRRRKAEMEAEGGEEVVRAIEAAPEDVRRAAKAAVLKRQIQTGKENHVTALLRRAKV